MIVDRRSRVWSKSFNRDQRCIIVPLRAPERGDWRVGQDQRLRGIFQEEKDERARASTSSLQSSTAVVLAAGKSVARLVISRSIRYNNNYDDVRAPLDQTSVHQIALELRSLVRHHQMEAGLWPCHLTLAAPQLWQAKSGGWDNCNGNFYPRRSLDGVDGIVLRNYTKRASRRRQSPEISLFASRTDPGDQLAAEASQRLCLR